MPAPSYSIEYGVSTRAEHLAAGYRYPTAFYDDSVTIWKAQIPDVSGSGPSPATIPYSYPASFYIAPE